MICPTQQNYRAMPAWLRPTVTQITVPHAMWIDNIPWYACIKPFVACPLSPLITMKPQARCT